MYHSAMQGSEMDTPIAIPQRRNTTLPENATDDLVVNMWLHGRPKTTQEAYRADIKNLNTFTGDRPLQQLTLKDLQDYQDSLIGQAPKTVVRRLSALKSLLTFCHKSGYTPVNVGKP